MEPSSRQRKAVTSGVPTNSTVTSVSLKVIPLLIRWTAHGPEECCGALHGKIMSCGHMLRLYDEENL